MNEILKVVWSVLNSPAVIAALGVGLVWLLARIFTAKPEWQKFEGTIIAAVKWAEKTIPDDVQNTAAARLDAAMRYVLKVYEQTQGKSPSEAVKDSLRDGVQVVHARLESAGSLESTKAAA